MDRILAHDQVDGNMLYLVKWQQMSYIESTWESKEDIQDDDKIKLYEKRQIPSASAIAQSKIKSFKPNPNDWKEYKESPKYNGGNQLRPYQLEGLNWLTFCYYHSRNSILADEMGLGKTIQIVSVLNHLFTKENCHGPFLILAPLITIPHWQREFEGWTDMNVVVYHGTAASREMIRDYEFYYPSQFSTNSPFQPSLPPVASTSPFLSTSISPQPPNKKSKPNQAIETPAQQQAARGLFKFNVLITTYEILMSDASLLSKIQWRYICVDEAHRLKNNKCKLINILRTFEWNHMTLLTGTPLQNNTEELWTLLNVVDPVKFQSQEDFLIKYGNLKETHQVEELHKILRPYLLRRMKEDVEKSIAAKEEIIIEVELTTIQKSYYRAIFERNFSSLNMGTKSSNVPSLLNIMMQLRKCCNHPYLLRGVEDNILQKQPKDEDGTNITDENVLMIKACGKLVLIDKLLPKLKAAGHKVLIFSQMVRMLDILEDYLIYKNYSYERIDGTKRGNERQESIDRFSGPESDRFVFLLCTRAGGLGINLTAADTCIIYDSDWNPQNDIQAQARCHRIGQTQTVKIYRLITRNTYEKVMFEKASMKLGLDQAVLTNMKSGGTPASSNATNNENMTTNAALRALDKEEISELLKYGAYKAFNDDKGKDTYDEDDIDKILERSSTSSDQNGNPNNDSSLLSYKVGQGVQTNQVGSSSFSKAAFISAEAESNAHIDVNDPDFWKKLMPDPSHQSNNQTEAKPAAASQSSKHKKENDSREGGGNQGGGGGGKSRKNQPRYSLRDTGDRFPGMGIYENEYLFSDDSGDISSGDGGLDNDDSNFEGGAIGWANRERSKLKNILSSYGYGQWHTAKEQGNLFRWSVTQIKKYADALIKTCAIQINEEEEALLKYLQKWCIYEKPEIDENAQPDDPTFTMDTNFSLYKQSNAKLFIRRLESIAKISKSVIQIVKKYGEQCNLPFSNQNLPCPTWNANDDRSLVLGTYYHGFGRYEKFIGDPRLTFSRFLPASGTVEVIELPEKMETETETDPSIPQGVEVEVTSHTEPQNDELSIKMEVEGERSSELVSSEDISTINNENHPVSESGNTTKEVKNEEKEEIAAMVVEKEEWPSEKILTRRLKRILRSIKLKEQGKVSDRSLNKKEAASTGTGTGTGEGMNTEDSPAGGGGGNVQSKGSRKGEKKRKRAPSTEWSKREKLAIYRYAVTFGIPKLDDSDSWNKIKTQASLTKKGVENIQQYCFELVSRSISLFGKDENIYFINEFNQRMNELKQNEQTEQLAAFQKIVGDLVLTKAQSKRLVQRVKMFAEIKDILLPNLNELSSLLNTISNPPPSSSTSTSLQSSSSSSSVTLSSPFPQHPTATSFPSILTSSASPIPPPSVIPVVNSVLSSSPSNPPIFPPATSPSPSPSSFPTSSLMSPSSALSNQLSTSSSAIPTATVTGPLTSTIPPPLVAAGISLTASSNSLSTSLVQQQQLNQSFLPAPWWKTDIHDKALIMGINKHGFGQWEKLCADQSLPFYFLAEEKLKNSNSQPIADEKKNDKKGSSGNKNCSDSEDSDSNQEDDDEPRRKRGRKADIYTTAIDFPKEKILMKRLEYLIQLIHHPAAPSYSSSNSLTSSASSFHTSSFSPSPSLSAESNIRANSNILSSSASNIPCLQLSPSNTQLNLSSNSIGSSGNIQSPSNSGNNTPKTSRSHKICAGRKPAVKKYYQIPYNADGTPQFPIIFGKMRVESLGTVVFDRPHYHNDRYIWPVGYKSVRPYQSFKNLNERTEYCSEILDGGDRPLFRVTAADSLEYPGVGNSPTAAWTGVLRRLNEKSNKPFNAVSGPEYFGLAKGIISKVCFLHFFFFPISLPSFTTTYLRQFYRVMSLQQV